MVTLSAYNMLPGLVVDVMGTPSILTRVQRIEDRRKVELEINSPDHPFNTVTLGFESQVTVLGTAPNCDPGAVELFED